MGYFAEAAAEQTGVVIPAVYLGIAGLLTATSGLIYAIAALIRALRSTPPDPHDPHDPSQGAA